MHVNHQNIVILIEQVIGPIAMMYIPVQDHDLHRAYESVWSARAAVLDMRIDCCNSSEVYTDMPQRTAAAILVKVSAWRQYKSDSSAVCLTDTIVMPQP